MSKRKKNQGSAQPVKPMSEDAIKLLVLKYFGDHLDRVKVSYCLHRVDIEVSYTDFLPERTVRHELERRIPYSFVTVEREISSAAAMGAFKKAWEQDEDWLVSLDGRLQKVNLWRIVFSYLQNKAIE